MKGINKIKKFEYLNQTELYKKLEDEFIINLEQINDKKDLFIQLQTLLHFPDYFGHNWDALNDCLKDFHWIEEKGIVIIHNKLPYINFDELCIYIELLYDVINDWKEDEQHYVKVIFPSSSKILIEQILSGNSKFISKLLYYFK